MELLINIDVPDLEQGIRFYEQGLGLGLSLKRKLFEGSVAELGGAPVPVYLVAKSAGTAPFPGASARRDYGRHWTPLHADFVVEDLAAAVARAEAAGARLEDGPETSNWGSIATLRDPFGHGFCLIEWAGGGYDEAESQAS